MKLLYALMTASLLVCTTLTAAETLVEDFTSIEALDPVRTTAAWNTNSGDATLGKTRPKFGEILSGAGFDRSLSADNFDFPNDYVFTDLNNDGLGDLFYITDGVNYYYMSVPGAQLDEQPAQSIFESGFDSSSTVVAGDVDNDGDKDIFVALDDSSPASRSYFYVNNGSATTPYSINDKYLAGLDGDRYLDAALADLNSDGFLDLVLAEAGGPIYLLNDQKEDPFDQAVRGDIGSGTQSLRQTLPADFNGDGLIDVLVVRSSGGQRLYLNDGSPQPFSAASAGLPLGNSASIERTTLVDLNNDGFMDVIGSRFSDDSYVYINGGPGVLFSQPETLINPNSSSSRFRAVADFNSDGLEDFALAASQLANFFINDGAGVSFQIISIGGLDNPFWPRAIDYNGDAVPDLAYSTGTSPEGLRIHLNTLSENPYSVGQGPQQFGLPAGLTKNLVVFDVDNDGDNDVAVAQNGNNLLFVNNGTPLLANSVSVTSDQDDTRAIAAADLNSDEFDDIIAANNGLNRWYPNDLGDGPFQRASTGVAIGSASVSSQAVATGDLNGDELVDIVFGNAGHNHVYYGASGDSPFDSTSVATPLGAMLLNTRGVIVADFDDDGDPDIATANDGVNYWYANDGSAEPFNADTVAQPLGADAAASNDITVADVDLDGLPDVVVANAGLNRWYRNSGAPEVFDADVDGAQLGIAEADSRALVANMAGGGVVEIAVANAGESPAHLYRLLQPGDQADVKEINLLETNSAGTSIAVGDIDGDGAPDIVLGNLLASDEVVFGTDQTASLAANAGFNLFADTVQSVALPDVTEVVATVALLPEDVVPTNTSIEYFVGTSPDRMQRIFPGLIVTLAAPSTELYWRARLSSLSPAVSPVIERLTFLVNALDTDSDQIADISDNCTVASNTGQLDADGDGFGNVCDTDLNNDGITNFTDLEILKQVFFSSAAAADFSADGVVNFDDLNIMKDAFFGPPGPAGAL